MIQIKFKNLEKSEMAKEAVLSRVQPMIEKFPDLQGSKIQVTLQMDNSQFQAGPDLFKVKLCVLSGRYKDVVIQKEDSNLYLALAEVIEHMLEVLNRHGDKARVKQRNRARKFAQEVENQDEDFEDEDLPRSALG